ncbi:MAG: hypothetical protein IJM44_05050 [Ruminococcus sp.]|nr:hypothetical protein [Ruminococcus sp.]
MNYKYITQDVIDSGVIRPENAEAAEEARLYNMDIALNLRRKGVYLMLTECVTAVHVITLLMELCIVLKPVMFPGAGRVNLAAAILGGLGYLYLLLRYVFKTPFKYQFSGYKYNRLPDGSEAPTTEADLSIMGAVMVGLVAVFIGIAFLPHGFTIMYAVSVAAFLAHLLTVIFYIAHPMRYKLPFTLLAALLPVIVSWQTLPFALITVVVAVLAHRRHRVLAQADGFPDFVPLTVKLTADGALKVDSYDKFNRFDGIDDEMESI